MRWHSGAQNQGRGEAGLGLGLGLGWAGLGWAGWGGAGARGSWGSPQVVGQAVGGPLLILQGSTLGSAVVMPPGPLPVKDVG